MKKNYFIFGIITVIVLLVVVIIFAIYNRPQRDLGKSKPEIALAPYVDVETTVSSLFLDGLYPDCAAPEVCPRDRVTLKIDKIDRIGDPNNVINMNVGDQVEFHLKYSARPAKLRSDILPSCRHQGEVFKSVACITEGCEGPTCTASSPIYAEKPAETEGDYIVYHLPRRTDKVTEKILPGLKKDSKIKFRIWGPDFENKEIGVYWLPPYANFPTKVSTVSTEE